MVCRQKHAAAALVFTGCLLPLLLAQKASAADMLTRDDGLAVVATALDERVHMRGTRDCSHLVHAIYDQAGFSYAYASSGDLYRGTDEFQRVKKPQPGDLIVWRGHVGIVVNPKRREFYSFLRHGPGTDFYNAQYWKQRGPVRFYRYIKVASDSAAQ
jgi:cell wall-associated NlpC family hydrolase